MDVWHEKKISIYMNDILTRLSRLKWAMDDRAIPSDQYQAKGKGKGKGTNALLDWVMGLLVGNQG